MLIGATSNTVSPPSCEEDAALVISDLVAGRLQDVASRLHEPPNYSAEEAAEDRRSIGSQLQFLLNQFGEVSSPSVTASPVIFYQISLAGGDIAYWQSLPSQGVDAALTYRVKFERVGPGIVQLTLIRSHRAWQLRSIALGLESSAPDSRSTMYRIGRAFLNHMDPRMSVEQVRQALDGMFGSINERPK